MCDKEIKAIEARMYTTVWFFVCTTILGIFYMFFYQGLPISHGVYDAKRAETSREASY